MGLLLLVLGTVAVVAVSCWYGLRRAYRLSRSLAGSSRLPGTPDVRPGTLRQLLRRDLGALVALGIVESTLALASPWPLKVVVDNAVGNAPLPTFLAPLHVLGHTGLAVAMSGAGLAMVGAMVAVGYSATILSATVAGTAGVTLQRSLMRRLLHAPLSYHDRARRGDLVSRLTTDVGYVQDSLLAKVELVLPKLLSVVAMAALMFALSPVLATVVLAAVPGLALLASLRRRAMARVQRRSRAASADLDSLANDLLGQVRAAQLFGRQESEADRFEAAAKLAALSSVTAARTAARLSPGPDLLLAADLAVVLVVGATFVPTHHLSLGALFVFLAYLASIDEPVRALSRLAATLGRGKASAERLGQLLSLAPEGPSGGDGEIGEGAPALEVEDVTFSYEDGAPVLKGLSFTVHAGETVCVMGRSGAGKSTLLSLLAGLREPQEGRVRIGGRDVGDLGPGAPQRRTALVPQDLWLVNGSISENISYGAPNATQAEVRRAGELALVHEFADRLPGGWDFQLGEGATRLSGGQRRRVAIARAILAAPAVLLLDEPTAGLDPAAGAEVTRAIRSVAAGRTVLIVTHDPALARVAHRKLTLGAGAGAGEHGPEHELVA